MANIRPITKSGHEGKRWRKYESYNHAKQDSVVILTSQELVKAAKALPICFIKSGDDFVPAALQSPVRGMNLFVAPNGKWLGGYVPAAYRGYPFVLGKSEQGDLLLCADMDSNLIGDEGEQLYIDGEPNPLVMEVLGFLQAVHESLEGTSRVCRLLSKHHLIVKWPLKVKTAHGDDLIDGIYCIDEAALNTLSAAALEEVRDGGGLTVAYCQLLSMQNTTLLQTLADIHTQTHAQASMATLPQNDVGELDLEFLKDDDILKF